MEDMHKLLNDSAEQTIRDLEPEWPKVNFVKKETAGVRKNDGKPMLSPIDPELLLEMGKGLVIGQEKYKDKAFNKKGNVMHLSTGYNSLMRHLLKFMSGENIDPDDDVHHLAKVINCAVVMWHNREQGDDRCQ